MVETSSAWVIFKEMFGGKNVDTTESLAGRVVIVTGSNQGLGFETAKQMAALGPAKLILAVRNLERGAAAVDRIKEAVPSIAPSLEVWQLDLSSFESVKRFAKRCETDLDRLDIVVHNAGMSTVSWSTTPDGWESTLQINSISTGLLATLLLPLLAKTAKENPESKPHNTLVGSEMHAMAAFSESKIPGSTLVALNTKEHANLTDRYNTSKLFNLYTVRRLAQLPSAAGVVTNVVNPGLCLTDFRTELPWALQVILNWLAKPTSEGAKAITYASVTASHSGDYLSLCKVQNPAAKTATPEGLALEAKVWEEMVHEWVKIAPEVETILKQ